MYPLSPEILASFKGHSSLLMMHPSSLIDGGLLWFSPPWAVSNCYGVRDASRAPQYDGLFMMPPRPYIHARVCLGIKPDRECLVNRELNSPISCPGPAELARTYPGSPREKFVPGLKNFSTPWRRRKDNFPPPASSGAVKFALMALGSRTRESADHRFQNYAR